MLERYIVFARTSQTSSGGWWDIMCRNHNVGDVISFKTMPEAIAAGRDHLEKHGGWYHVVDLHTGKIVSC